VQSSVLNFGRHLAESAQILTRRLRILIHRFQVERCIAKFVAERVDSQEGRVDITDRRTSIKQT